MGSNPRFKHICRISRILPATPFSSDGTKDVYSGKCRAESSDNIRTFKTGQTTVGQLSYFDYRVSVPGDPDIRRGDIIDITIGKAAIRELTILSNPDYSELGDATEFYCNFTAH